jgi:hypothetical protein
MSKLTEALTAAAGNAGGDSLYVEDVFSTYLYEGNGSGNTIRNGIALGSKRGGPSTEFDGVSDYLSRSSDFTGNADGKTFTFSAWVYLEYTASTSQRVLYATDASDNGIFFHVQGSETIGFEAWNAAGTKILQAATSTVIADNTWTNIIVSVDMANSSNRSIYFNDVAASVSWYTYTNAAIDFTRATPTVGEWGNGTRQFFGSLAHVFLDYTYRDMSVKANRRLFITADQQPASQATQAALNPILYLPMTDANPEVNAGTGGDFTVNGSPTFSPTFGPADSSTITGEGGLVWTKTRNNTFNHYLVDTERGVDKNIYTNQTYAEGSIPEGITSFNSNGYSIGNTTGYNASSSYNYASWTFRKAEGFFYQEEVVKASSTTKTVDLSSLGTVGMVAVKRTDSTGDWIVWHRSATTGDLLYLNTTAAETLDGSITMSGTTLSLVDGTITDGTYIVYAWAHDAQVFGADGDESVIKCGSFTTDGSAVFFESLGFEPQWVLVKRSDNTASWNLLDTMRGLFSEGTSGGKYLRPDTSGAEGNLSSTDSEYVNATGFGGNGNGVTGSANATFIYIAIRRPMKVPESGTEVYNNLANRIGTSAAATISGVGFAVDLMIPFGENTGSTKPFVDRLRGPTKYLLPPYTNAEQTNTDVVTSFASNDGVLVGADASLQVINKYYDASRRYAASFFKRASGFMDVVCYSGTGATGNAIAHNLTVAPELAIFKGRSGVMGNNDWQVIANFTGANYIKMVLNTANAALGPYTYAINAGIAAVPTAETITVDNTANFNNGSSNYVLYLFATLAGVSKVGSYTGTGADLNVDCGFTAGARFILIKRTDSTGDWYMWDSARGINAGNSPYLIINTTGASVTNTDYIDPLNAGFTVTSTAPAAINASGGSYIFLAIA